ncbi:AT-hook motif nuclear-localized protein [Psidium guajava]|nr:AT-hook motif nuclear-localized protein [Psidium guajava]
MANNRHHLSYLLGLAITVFAILVSVGMSNTTWPASYKEYTISAAAAPTPGVTAGGGGSAAARPHLSLAFAVASFAIALAHMAPP